MYGARARQRAAEAPLRHGRVCGRAHARAALRRAPAAGARVHVHGQPRGLLRHMAVSVHSQSSTGGCSIRVGRPLIATWRLCRTGSLEGGIEYTTVSRGMFWLLSPACGPRHTVKRARRSWLIRARRELRGAQRQAVNQLVLGSHTWVRSAPCLTRATTAGTKNAMLWTSQHEGTCQHRAHQQLQQASACNEGRNLAWRVAPWEGGMS